jgi:hypothetical protein
VLTTGERVRLHNRSGSSATNQTIMGIWDAANHPIPLSRYHFVENDIEHNDENSRNLGLMTVWQVDANYNFTGFQYANADGAGHIDINNPAIGAFLHIDSSNYAAPARSETFSSVLAITNPNEGRGVSPSSSGLLHSLD